MHSLFTIVKMRYYVAVIIYQKLEFKAVLSFSKLNSEVKPKVRRAERNSENLLYFEKNSSTRVGKLRARAPLAQ